MNNFLIYYIIIMPKSRKQKLYKMRGCSKKKKSRKHKGGAKYNGGANMNLAYTGKAPIFSTPNPHLAYTGSNKTGGTNASNSTNSSNMRVNTNAANPVYPNTGGPPAHQNWINSSTQRGGSCGGTCGLLKGGNNGLPYGQGLAPMKPILAPSGLTGSKWDSNFGWPGTNNVGGDHNHYPLNKYEPFDISRQIKDTGAQPPFLGGGRKKNKGKSKKQRGGTLSNFLYQDLVNVGRQFQFGLGSTYNALSGYGAPVNPMPWNQPGLSNPSVFRQ
jgi:hypothetical protein